MNAELKSSVQEVKKSDKPNPISKQFLDGSLSNVDRSELVEYLADDKLNKYIIFFTGRCGSTLLTHLIKETHLCGFPDEFFNDSFIHYAFKVNGEMTFREYISWLINKHSENGYFGFEIDPMRLGWLQYFHEFKVDNLLSQENTKFIWLTRKDIVSQGFSYAMAKKRGLWHNFSNDTKEASTDVQDPELTDENVWIEIFSILADEQWMETGFQRTNVSPLRIDYETLIAERQLTLGRILNWIGITEDTIKNITFPSVDPTSKLAYDTKTMWLLGFFNRYSKILDFLQDNRQTINVDELFEQLNSQYEINIDKNRLRIHQNN